MHHPGDEGDPRPRARRVSRMARRRTSARGSKGSAVLVLLLACSPQVGLEDGGSPSSATTSEGSPTTSMGPSTSPTTASATMTTGTVELTTGVDPDEGGSSTGVVIPEDCSLVEQDCPAGYKCMPWPSPDGSLGDTVCLPTVDDPHAPGEPCMVMGGGVVDVCRIAPAGVLLSCFETATRWRRIASPVRPATRWTSSSSACPISRPRARASRARATSSAIARRGSRASMAGSCPAAPVRPAARRTARWAAQTRARGACRARAACRGSRRGRAHPSSARVCCRGCACSSKSVAR